MPVRQVPINECCAWIEAQGIAYYDKYNSFLHTDQAYPGIESKSWKVRQPTPGELLYGDMADFAADVFSLLPDWTSLMYYPRDGNWDATLMDPDDSNYEPMLAGFFKLAGVSLELDSGIQIDERDAAIAAWLFYVWLAVGWGTDTDTYAIAEGGRFHLFISHHDYVDVNFRDTADRDRFDAGMRAKGYDYVRWTRAEKEEA